MLHTRSFRIGKNPDLREINNRLGLLRPFQVKGLSVSNRHGNDGELILLHDEKEAPHLIETHPRFGSIINTSSGPSHFLMLFDQPIAQTDLELNGAAIAGEISISGDFVRVPVTGNISGEFIVTGRVQSREGVWSDSDCLVAYSLASTAPHMGMERPNHLDDGRLKCVNLSVDSRNTSMDVQNTLMKRKGVKADEIVAFAKERRNDMVDNTFMIHRSPAPPNLVRIYPGHGSSLPSGGSYNIAAAFDKKLAPENWGSVFVDDVDRTSAVTLHDDGFSLTLPIIETTGTHSIRWENLTARHGETRKFAIISSFTIMPVEWTNPVGVDMSAYYTSIETDALFVNYYTQGQLNALFQMYYFSWDIDKLIADHVVSNDHDGRYYTETEVDGLISAIDLTDLNDVTITGPVTGEVLQYTASGWVNAANPAGVTTLAAMSDVNLVGLGMAQMLRYDTGSSKWGNFYLTAGDAVTINHAWAGVLSVADGDVQLALDTIDSHLHDSRYYTETEIDAALLSHAEVVTRSGTDFGVGDINDINTASQKQIGVRIDNGNESIQLHISGAIFIFEPV